MKTDFQFGVNTMIGCRTRILRRLEREFATDPQFRRRHWWSRMISRIISGLAYFDDRYFKKHEKEVQPQAPPVFVIGHWRSGTTFLHNYLTRVFPAAFTTTYQSVFTNNLFAFQGIIKWFLQIFLPRKRPKDHIKMHSDLPQEEELALGNSVFFSFYYWFYFPNDAYRIADQFLWSKAPYQESLNVFKAFYPRFIKRCFLNTGGQIFVSKNPSNTARIKLLLELYPDARFIYIYRNPYEVIQSSIIFFKSVVMGMRVQNLDEEHLKSFLLDLYKKLILTYQEDRQIIPSGQLFEIKYENLMEDPEPQLKELALNLNLGLAPEFNNAKTYLMEAQGYTSRDYHFPPEYLQWINENISDLIELQGYSLKGEKVPPLQR